MEARNSHREEALGCRPGKNTQMGALLVVTGSDSGEQIPSSEWFVDTSISAADIMQ
jgi:hypothetical protein